MADVAMLDVLPNEANRMRKYVNATTFSLMFLLKLLLFVQLLLPA